MFTVRYKVKCVKCVLFYYLISRHSKLCENSLFIIFPMVLARKGVFQSHEFRQVTSLIVCL